MIKFRPIRGTVSLSVKSEETFHTIDDMIRHIHENICHIIDYIGAEHYIRISDITVSDVCRENPVTGWKSERAVSVRWMEEEIHIGFCGK